jgi:OHCU decarboxylase
MYKENIPTIMNRNKFLKVFGGVYEHSMWIAEKVYDDGIKTDYNNAEGLQCVMQHIVEAAEKKQKLALLCAHPDLAGKISISASLTAASKSEQSSANLDNCTPAEFNLFQSLNHTYNKKFGFPFILAVRGYQRAKILEIFQNRINNDVEIEFNEALKQVHRIALLRLNEIE